MKPRSTLKDYFKKGAIPKESDFADLIDSMLVQDEDSVFKSPNDPLSIKATGAEEALLKFYTADQGSTKPSWLLKQKPGNKPGLSIHDGDGASSRLFIESGTGRVGIGTTEPKSPLSVSGGAAIGASYAPTNAAPANGLLIEGNVGIGIVDPGTNKLSVVGNTRLDGTLSVTGTTSLSDDLRINDKLIYLRSSTDTTHGLGWFGNKQFAATNVDGPVLYGWAGGALGTTNGGQKIVLTWNKDNKVGIGTLGPRSFLSVSGGTAIGATYAGTNEAPANGLIVEGNVGIGTNDPKNTLQLGGNLHLDGNSIFLRTGPNDQYDVIKWNSSVDRIDIGGYVGVNLGYTSQAPNAITPVLTVTTGNVGIGTTTPRAKLDVDGYIMGRNPYDRNFRDGEASGGQSDSARIKAILQDKPEGTFLIGGPTPNYPYHIFFYWRAGGKYYRTWIPLDRNVAEAF